MEKSEKLIDDLQEKQKNEEYPIIYEIKNEDQSITLDDEIFNDEE